MCVAESKLDSSFSVEQFLVTGFKIPIRLDVTDKSGGLLLYARDKLPLRQLNCPVRKSDIQCIVADLNLRKQKWLVLYIYRNPKQDIRYFLDELTKIIDYYSSDYENLIIMGDFNEESSQTHMNNFMSNYNLYNLIKRPTCYKSSEGRCIDLILTNKNRSFLKTNSFETGISDHHHLIYTMFKTTYDKSPPHIVHYRSYRNFSVDNFRRDISKSLMDNVTGGDFDLFNSIFEKVLDAHAPKKKRTIRGNQKPHLTKTLRKAIMRRSFLKNKANTTGDPYFYYMYKKQRNYIVNLNEKAKERHFASFVEFLFLTGCRPSEASGLKWQNVDLNRRVIIFCEAVVEGHRKKGTKTGVDRFFPINEQLLQLLNSIERIDQKVFRSEKGRPVDIHNFLNRKWKPLLQSLSIRYRPVYHCRHTFISICMEEKISPAKISKWVGNSQKVLLDHYSGTISDEQVPTI